MNGKPAHHVLTLPLSVSSAEAFIVDRRLVVLGKLRNAVLGALIKRVNAMRRDERWRKAAAMPSGKERSAAYGELREEYGVRQFDATAISTRTLQESKWMRDHVPSAAAQAAALQVYTSVNEWVLGKRGKPRFKRSDECDVMWGATAGVSVYYDAAANELVVGANARSRKLRLAATKTPQQISRLANGGVVRSAAVKRETVRGGTRYFALLRVKGEPYRSAEYLSGVAVGKVVGLDAGPSRLAVVGDDEAYFVDRAPAELLKARRADQARIRRAQRALDRSRRATNPDCFDDKGRWIKGKKAEVRSAAYERKRGRLASEQRRARVNRREDEGEIARRIMRSGNIVAVEDVNYNGWHASSYGKRMGFTAPGALMERIKREALLTAGAVFNLPLGLALSQHCVCGERRKKGLGERVHSCERCGLVADRDLLPSWFCREIVAAGLAPDCHGTTLGPLLGRVVAAVEYDPNDPEQVRALGGRLTPSGSCSVKPTLVGSSEKAEQGPGNTRVDSTVAGTPGKPAKQREQPLLSGA